MIHAAGPNEPINVVAIQQGTSQRFQKDRAHALSWDITIASFTETSAFSLGRSEAARTQQHVFVRMQGGIDTARNGQLALAPAQAFAGQVNARERGGTHRIDR